MRLWKRYEIRIKIESVDFIHAALFRVETPRFYLHPALYRLDPELSEARHNLYWDPAPTPWLSVFERAVTRLRFLYASDVMMCDSHHDQTSALQPGRITRSSYSYDYAQKLFVDLNN